MDFPKATVPPAGAAYRIAEALMHPDVTIVGAGAVLYRLATELGITDELNVEIDRAVLIRRSVGAA